MKLIIDISEEEYKSILSYVQVYNSHYADMIRNGKPYEERPIGECKDCKYYYPYHEQFTRKPRGDGYCEFARMSSEGVTYINCSDNWSCADFCPKADMRGKEE